MGPGRFSRCSKFAAWFSLASIYFSPVNAQTLDAIKQTIRKKFPEVRQISTAELAGWLNDTNRPQPLLMDVRTAEEFAVSHLRNARHWRTVKEVKSAVASNNVPIVTYCSVGYRSSAMAEKLQRAGFTSVFNLEGSIFAWANEQRPVFRDNAPAQSVHPYDRKWGQMLRPELRARR